MKYYSEVTRTNGAQPPLSFADLINPGQITRAYAELTVATSAYHAAGEAEIAAKATLEHERAAALADGRIEGRNAELREAAARELLANLFAAAETAECEAREAKHRLDLARIKVEEARALLRLAEIAGDDWQTIRVGV